MSEGKKTYLHLLEPESDALRLRQREAAGEIAAPGIKLAQELGIEPAELTGLMTQYGVIPVMEAINGAKVRGVNFRTLLVPPEGDQGGVLDRLGQWYEQQDKRGEEMDGKVR